MVGLEKEWWTGSPARWLFLTEHEWRDMFKQSRDYPPASLKRTRKFGIEHAGYNKTGWLIAIYDDTEQENWPFEHQ